MSSRTMKNAVPRRAYKERSQPESRKKFGFLEKRKDHRIRAHEFQKKKDMLQRLQEKAANRNPLEFNFRMIKTKTIDGVHRPESEANKYTPEELLLMKKQDIGYVFQKIQSEKKKVEKLKAVLHSLDNRPSNRHVYFAEDSEEAKEIQSKSREDQGLHTSGSLPDAIKRKVDGSYKELEARMKRVENLERVHAEMTLQKELQKKGRKRKLREDEIVSPTSKPVYKWRPERKG